MLNKIVQKINKSIKNIFSPDFFIILNAFIFFISLNAYYFNFDASFCYFLIALLLIIYLTLKFPTSCYVKRFEFGENLFLKDSFWIFYSIVVLCANLCEFAYFGIPFLSLFGIGKSIIYADYGFSLIHHISVGSWILVFVKTRKVVINNLFLLFSLINPILIINRDLLLLTFLSFFLLSLLNNKRTKKALIIAICVILLFVVMGNLRSGNALKNTNLPFKSKFVGKTQIFIWLMTYATSSYFNFVNNLYTKSRFLKLSNINVFPESYYFYEVLDTFGFFVFYIIVCFFLISILKKAEKKRYFRVFFVYMFFQSCMTVFSRKFFTTDTLYELMVFMLFGIWLWIKKYIRISIQWEEK